MRYNHQLANIKEVVVTLSEGNEKFYYDVEYLNIEEDYIFIYVSGCFITYRIANIIGFSFSGEGQEWMMKDYFMLMKRKLKETGDL